MVTCTNIVNNPGRVKRAVLMAKQGGRFCSGRRFGGSDVHRVLESHWPRPKWASAFATQNELYYTEEN